VGAELETWERKHYEEGGGQPWLFYVVFGKVDFTAPLARRLYRCDGPPDGIDVMSYGPDMHWEVPESFRDGYLWDEFVAADPACATRVLECDRCVVLRGTPADATTLNYLRDTIGLITYMLDNGGCAVYDPQMFHWWNPTDWKRRLFNPAAPIPRCHTVVLVSEEHIPSLKWYHTRGMRKFGRPDISVRSVSDQFADGVIDLCSRLIEYQAFGHVVPDGQEVSMASLPPGGVIEYGGDLDDPEFNNVHLEVTWPMGVIQGNAGKRV
jgi:hypothetical protein